MDYRPCGACGQLVDAGGCEHWRPSSASRVRLRDRTVADLEPEQLSAKRQRDAELRRAQRAAAKRRVEDFRRAMGVNG